MNIQLFNFLEDNNAQIVEMMKSQLLKKSPHYKEFSGSDLQKFLEYLLDGYIDFLVTGQTDSLDRLFQALSRMLVFRGTDYSDILETPLFLSTVIRRLLIKEYDNLKGQDAIKKFNTALELTENTANKAACRFLDVFHENLNKYIKNKNAYLDQTQNELDIGLPSFLIEPMEN